MLEEQSFPRPAPARPRRSTEAFHSTVRESHADQLLTGVDFDPSGVKLGLAHTRNSKRLTVRGDMDDHASSRSPPKARRRATVAEDDRR
jgi:hypothetical protein